MASGCGRRLGSDAKRSLDLSDVEELVIGGGEGDGAQGHIEHVAVEFDVGRLAELIGGEVGEQALGVLADAGQCPTELGQRGFRLGVGQGDAADRRDRELGRDFSAKQHQLGVEPALGVDDMQEDLADRPFGRGEAVAEAVVGACVEERSQLVEVLLERGMHIYKISDDVYLNVYPA